jgi:hypothetical protein
LETFVDSSVLLDLFTDRPLLTRDPRGIATYTRRDAHLPGGPERSLMEDLTSYLKLV